MPPATPLLLRCLSALLCPLLIASSSASAQLLSGEVHSDVFASDLEPGQSSFHLLLQRDDDQGGTAWHTAVIDQVTAELRARGYSRESPLLDADVVIVVRYGANADYPSVDAVLAGADPDLPMTTGARYLRVEAYDLKAYLPFFIAQETSAPEDAATEFLLWQTTVVSHGALDELPVVLPALLAVASDYLASSSNDPFSRSL